MNNTFNVEVLDKTYKLKIVKRKNCKRIILKISLKNKQPVLSIPYSVTYQKAIEFFKANHKWVDNQLDQTTSKSLEYHFASLSEISIAGDIYKIVKKTAKKNNIDISLNLKELYLEFTDFENEAIIEKKFILFLKKLAKTCFYNISEYKAKEIGVNFVNLSVSDTTSKWGSCSSSKKLQYNYRIIMAPIFVIDYVISHEVAHLVELNHGTNFWNIVNNLTPHKYKASSWLKHNSKSLY